jgi:hypothetical protein
MVDGWLCDRPAICGAVLTGKTIVGLASFISKRVHFQNGLRSNELPANTL